MYLSYENLMAYRELLFAHTAERLSHSLLIFFKRCAHLAIRDKQNTTQCRHYAEIKLVSCQVIVVFYLLSSSILARQNNMDQFIVMTIL